MGFSGTLGERPLPHVLIHVLEHRLSGSLEVGNPENGAAIVFAHGYVVKIRTTSPVAYLGTVLYELGFIDPATMSATLMEVSKRKLLHGQVLLEQGAITQEQLAAGIQELTLRKLAHVCMFDREAEFEFQDGVDILHGWAEAEPILTDPMPAIWVGIRDNPPLDHVQATLSRAEPVRFRLAAGTVLERFRLRPEERTLAEQLLGHARGVETFGNLQIMPRRSSELLLYCLLVTHHLETIAAPSKSAFPLRPGKPTELAGSGPPSSRPVMAAPPPSRPGMTSVPSRPSIPAGRPSRPVMVAPPPSRPSRPGMTSAPPSRPAMPSAPPSRPAMPHSAPPSAPPSRPAPPSGPPSRPAMSSTRPIAQPSGPPSSRPVAHPSGPPSSRQIAATDDAPASRRPTELDTARACFARGELDRAEQLARSAHRANSKDPAPLTLLAWYEAQGPANHGVDATKIRIRMLTMATNLDPDYVDAYFYRALLRKRMGDYRNACADLGTVLELDPDRPDARSELRECEELLSRGGPGLLDRILKR